MIISSKSRSSLFAVLLASLSLCLLARASAQVNFAFNNPNTAIWDLSGGYQFDQAILGAGGQTIPLSFAVSFNQDARGFLRNSDITFVGIGNDFVAGQYTLTGKVSGGGRLPTRVTLLVNLSGQDVIAGKDTTFKITLTYNLTVDASGVSGMARGTAHFSKLGGGRIKSDVSAPLPAGMDGSWGLQLNYLPLARLGGTASIVLSNGRTLSANLAGSFSARTDLSKVQLTGTGDSRGVSVHVNFTTGILQSVNGLVLGETVRE